MLICVLSGLKQVYILKDYESTHHPFEYDKWSHPYPGNARYRRLRIMPNCYCLAVKGMPHWNNQQVSLAASIKSSSLARSVAIHFAVKVRADAFAASVPLMYNKLSVFSSVITYLNCLIFTSMLANQDSRYIMGNRASAGLSEQVDLMPCFWSCIRLHRFRTRNLR